MLLNMSKPGKSVWQCYVRKLSQNAEAWRDQRDHLPWFRGLAEAAGWIHWEVLQRVSAALGAGLSFAQRIRKRVPARIPENVNSGDDDVLRRL